MPVVDKSSIVIAETDRPGHRPAVAAALSLLVPGLGQVYNQSSKGVLFLCVGVINLFLVGLVLFSEQLVRTIYALARRADLPLNEPVFGTLHWIHSTPPVIAIVVLFALAFAAYCVRDAYNDARLRRAPSAPASDNLSKAAGASYVGHIAVLFFFIVLGSMVVPKSSPDQEKSVCEFVLQNENEKNREKTDIISLNSSAAHGRFDERKELNNTRASAPAEDAEPVPEPEKSIRAQQAALFQAPRPQQQPLLQQNEAKPVMENEPVPKPAARPAERQAQVKQATPLRNALQPEVKLTKQAEKPEPEQKEHQRTIKKREAAKQQRAVQPQQMVKPVQQRAATPPKTAPDFRARNASRKAPELAGRSFNQRRDVDDHDGAVAANADVNFGPYMQQLQRRLKRNWNPPASSVARAVTVHFKIQSDGRISNLRLARSSGIGGCDSAALQAVESASPVMPLPPGSPASVPIEFTFEYTKH